MVTVASREVPEALVARLAPGGLVIAVGSEGGQELRVLVCALSGIETRSGVLGEVAPMIVGP